MKKLFLSFIFLFSCFSLFSFTEQLDILAGGFYNYCNVFKGSAVYEKEIDYDYYIVDGDYRAAFSAGGGFMGLDCFFYDSPFGFYFRSGLIKINNVKRTAGGTSVLLNNTEITFSEFLDLGGVYSLNFNDYFSLCAAPALSIIFLDSEYRAYNYYYTRATIDAVFGAGLTADIYAKLRISYFVATVGCAVSFYPLALVISTDSNIYYNDVTNTMAFNIRPYVSIGVSLKV